MTLWSFYSLVLKHAWTRSFDGARKLGFWVTVAIGILLFLARYYLPPSRSVLVGWVVEFAWTLPLAFLLLSFLRLVIRVPHQLYVDVTAALAEQFIHATCARQGIDRGQLTIHADRGSAMTAKPVAFLLADLGVTKTHSRPHVSNDNPFSEAQFKTLKYRPDFPERFGAIQDARAHCHAFFPWYNTEHHHTGLGLLTPADVHHGLAEQRIAARATVLATAYSAHPERFAAGLPHPPAHPGEVWINPSPGSPYPRGRYRPRRRLRLLTPLRSPIIVPSIAAWGRSGEAHGSPCKAREGEGESQATAFRRIAEYRTV